jgi:hypothetical protein
MKPRDLGNAAREIIDDVNEIAEREQPKYLEVASLIIAENDVEATQLLQGMAKANYVVSKALFLLLMKCQTEARDVIAAYKRENKS